MKKQTAVEWLISQQKHNKFFNDEIIEQAKEMNKDNIEYICLSAIIIMLDNLEHGQEFNVKQIFEKVYNETYKSE